MDGRSFDALARRFTTGLSRREALTGMAGAGSSLLLGHAPASAGCKKVGKKCDKNKDCGDNARCGGKKCKCKGEFAECGGKCYALDKDDKHCGSCNTACSAGESCVDGVCTEGGCTAGLDSCVEGAPCIACPQRADSVCYRDEAGTPRCSRVLLCVNCEEDLDCAAFGANARCVTSCSGQCSGTACAGG